MQVGAQPLAMPLHEQVLRIFKQKLRGGEWTTGALIPGEAALSQELGVSIGTVRRALDRLSQDRLLIRARGRGTYVAEKPVSRFGISITQCDGARVKYKVANSCVSAEPDRITDAVVERLRRGIWRRSPISTVASQWEYDGKVIVNEMVYLNRSECLIIDDKVLRENNPQLSALELLQAHCNLEFGKLEWSLSFDRHSQDSGEQCGSSGKPITAIHVAAMDRRNRCILIARLLLLQAGFGLHFSN